MPKNKKPSRKAAQPASPHAIPSKPWEHISIDLIGPLPESQGYNAVLVIVDRFSKMIILIATNTELNAVGTACIYRDHIPNHVTSIAFTGFFFSFFLSTLFSQDTIVAHVLLDGEGNSKSP